MTKLDQPQVIVGSSTDLCHCHADDDANDDDGREDVGAGSIRSSINTCNQMGGEESKAEEVVVHMTPNNVNDKLMMNDNDDEEDNEATGAITVSIAAVSSGSSTPVPVPVPASADKGKGETAKVLPTLNDERKMEARNRNSKGELVVVKEEKAYIPPPFTQLQELNQDYMYEHDKKKESLENDDHRAAGIRQANDRAGNGSSSSGFSGNIHQQQPIRTTMDEQRFLEQVDINLPEPIPDSNATTTTNSNRATRNRQVGHPGAFAVYQSNAARRAPGRLEPQPEEEDTVSGDTPGETHATTTTVEASGNSSTTRGHAHTTATPTRGSNDIAQDPLLRATLVSEEDLVEAVPAPEGLRAIIMNKQFQYLMGGLSLVMLAVILTTSLLIPRRAEPGEPITLLSNQHECGSYSLAQADYRGNLSTTINGHTCARWDSGPLNYVNPASRPYGNLVENYCRNADLDVRAWCYVTTPGVTSDYCDVPYCDSTLNSSLLLKDYCGTLIPHKQIDYRGTVAISATGKECQRWDSQEPHSHTRTADQYPDAGLEENYCRNPDNEAYAWCYTTSELHRWEYCDIPACSPLTNWTHDDAKNESCSGCTLAECGSKRFKQKDYTGERNRTRSGKACLPWNEAMNLNDMDNATMSLFLRGTPENYCRNPGAFNRSRAWCHTADDDGWEYCDVPFCDDNFTPRRFCGSGSLNQADYRGAAQSTVNGTTCAMWLTSKEANSNGHTAENFPWAGLVGGYCRNPDLSQPRAWCYLQDGSTDFCEIPECKDCGTPSQKRVDYRGTHATTTTGKTCQSWADKVDHIPSLNTGQWLVQFEEWGLEYNFCRNPGGEHATTWCFVDTNSTEWEYCLVKDCDGDTSIPGNSTCGSFALQQKDYRGDIDVTVTGKICQDWKSQVHKFNADERPNDGLESNRCRNPDGKSQGAWCFTNASEQLWEFCNVPFCEESESFPAIEECGTLALRQEDYRGSQNVTSKGLVCQKWSSQEPHPHSFIPSADVSSGLEENYCRNPDQSEKAWCFTTDPAILWDYCDVPACEIGGRRRN